MATRDASRAGDARADEPRGPGGGRDPGGMRRQEAPGGPAGTAAEPGRDAEPRPAGQGCRARGEPGGPQEPRPQRKRFLYCEPHKRIREVLEEELYIKRDECHIKSPPTGYVVSGKNLIPNSSLCPHPSDFLLRMDSLVTRTATHIGVSCPRGFSSSTGVVALDGIWSIKRNLPVGGSDPGQLSRNSLLPQAKYYSRHGGLRR